MHTGHFEVLAGRYRLTWDDGDPDSYYTQRQRATIVDEMPHDEGDAPRGALSVSLADGSWPFLLLRHSGTIPWAEDTLRLDVVLVPETDVLFVGAHREVRAYDLQRPVRLWTDPAEMGFLGWQRHGEAVIMAAELELAAWTLHGQKLWSTFVEPPYDYSIVDNRVELTVMGVLTTFPLASGPSWGGELPWRSKG
jgi:hypothetical protein